MNNSWNKNYTASPGFVYFNADAQNSPSNQAHDYISFQESPSSNYSNNYDRRSSNNFGSPKFHSSPRKFNNRNAYSRFSGNQSFSPKGKNFQSPKSYQNKFNSSPMINKSGRDMSLYFDPTSTENPWEALEKEYELEKTKEEAAKEKAKEENSELEDEESGSSDSTSSSSENNSNQEDS